MAKATCCSCQRTYEASDFEVKLVQAGKCEALCPNCDRSHDDEGYDKEDL